MQEDDFKISMEDIKDIVSEFYGEKIQKVEQQKAKQILSEYTEELLLKDIEKERINIKVEEEINREIKEKKAEIISEENIKSMEDEIRKKIEAELREKIKLEIEEERKIKRKELLQKLEESSKISCPEPAEEKQELLLNFNEKLSLINLFEQTQKVLALMLSKLIKRVPIEKMLCKTLEKAIEKHPDILKKVNYNQYSKIKTDGSLEVGRLAANLNGLNLSEDKKTDKLFNVLHEIFEERLIALELALGIDTKNDNYTT